jgi:hypothetical protein
MLNQIDNFLTKGYAHFNVGAILDLSKFKITNVEINDNLENNFSDEERLMITEFVDFVSKYYVAKTYNSYEVLYFAVWDGVDLGSAEWHNDKVEGFDFNVLYYYDNTDEETGGSIQFQYPDGEHVIYPKTGDLVFINQSGLFKHKASRSTHQRRVASIEYSVH